jgi:hypothetical protein
MLDLRFAAACAIAFSMIALAPCAQAQDCGDANGDGSVNIGDALYLMQYFYAGGIPPEEIEMADMDDHKLLTIMDAALLLQSALTCDIIDPPCPPELPAWEPPLHTGYRVLYPESFPANTSSYAVDLTFVSPNVTWYASFPLRIRIDGMIPTIDSVSFPEPGSVFDSTFSLVQVFPDSGYVVFGSQCFLHSGVIDVDRFATVYLSIAPDPDERPIQFDWVILSPSEAPSADSSISPVVGGYCKLFLFEPWLVSSCCVLAGDVDGNGVVDIDDVVYLIEHIFGGSFPPPCYDQANADGIDSVDIDDVVYLIEFIFAGGDAPICGYTGS